MGDDTIGKETFALLDEQERAHMTAQVTQEVRNLVKEIDSQINQMLNIYGLEAKIQLSLTSKKDKH